MARRRARNQGCSGETPGGHRCPICAARPPRAGAPPGTQTLACSPLPRPGPLEARGLGAGGRRGPGGRVGGGGGAGLPSSADFMVPRACGAGPKVSPLPQTAAGGPSGNLEGTGKLVLGIHAAAARSRRRSGTSGRSRPGRAPGRADYPRRTRAARAPRRAPRRNVIEGRVREWRGRPRPGPKWGGAWRGSEVCARARPPDPARRLCRRVRSLEVSL